MPQVKKRGESGACPNAQRRMTGGRNTKSRRYEYAQCGRDASFAAAAGRDQPTMTKHYMRPTFSSLVKQKQRKNRNHHGFQDSESCFSSMTARTPLNTLQCSGREAHQMQVAETASEHGSSLTHLTASIDDDVSDMSTSDSSYTTEPSSFGEEDAKDVFGYCQDGFRSDTPDSSQYSDCPTLGLCEGMESSTQEITDSLNAKSVCQKVEKAGKKWGSRNKFRNFRIREKIEPLGTALAGLKRIIASTMGAGLAFGMWFLHC